MVRKMVCRYCKVVMIGGTSYYQNKNGRDNLTRKRFSKCPKCNDIVYNNSPNFQEFLHRAMGK